MTVVNEPGKSLVVYLAGPMSGLPEYNYPAFHEAAERWREYGYTVLNPAENFNGAQDKNYREYIREDLHMLVKANSIALLPGWEKSKGARFELHVAQLMEFAVWDAVTMRTLDVPKVATVISADEYESILLEAERIVAGARQAAYGHPIDDFSKTANMWTAIFGVPVTAEQVALAMISVKMSRLLNTPTHRDSMVDIAGYAKTYQLVVDERKRRQAQ